jgi:hypothetical protein
MFFRRAVAERAENIGIWFKILDMIAHFAVISNVSFAVNATKKSDNITKKWTFFRWSHLISIADNGKY